MLRFFRLCSKQIAPPLPRISHFNPLWFSSTQTKPSNIADVQSQYANIFQKIKLEPKLINNTLPNAKLSNCLANLCQRIDISNCEKRHGKFIILLFIIDSIGIFLYTIASKLTVFPVEKQDILANYVLQDKIISSQQLDRAINFVKNTKEGPEVPGFLDQFEKYCGVIIPIDLTSQ